MASSPHLPAVPRVAIDARPTIVHVVHRFDTGGLENGVVNLINHLPAERFRHVILALTEVTEFRRRLAHDDVTCIALHKPPGHALRLYPRLYRIFRQLRPAIVHTRNLGTLEVAVPAWAAGVPVRIHGEHGRDAADPDGRNRRYQQLRRLYAPFVNRWVALSEDLARYLTDAVGIARPRVSQIYNGVDLSRFAAAGIPAGTPTDATTGASPARSSGEPIEGCPFNPQQHRLVGTVGRMVDIKDQTNLARAFVALLAQRPDWRDRLRLVMVGDGALRAQVQQILAHAGLSDLAWLPGERSDVAAVLRGLHLFVLPSLGEGVSNTILEAMASGLPVVATRVGGNAELVREGHTGLLVPPADPAAMATALLALLDQPGRARAMGQTGRADVERRFSMAAMVGAYQGLYEQQLLARAAR